MQSVQPDMPTYRPAAQDVHVVAPPFELELGGHDWHAVDVPSMK